MIVKIALLGLVLAIAIFGAFPLIEQRSGWAWPWWSWSPR